MPEFETLKNTEGESNKIPDQGDGKAEIGSKIELGTDAKGDLNCIELVK